MIPALFIYLYFKNIYMKKRFEIYVDDEFLQGLEEIKKMTGFKKPGMALKAAIFGYIRLSQKNKDLSYKLAEVKKILMRNNTE